MASAYIGPGESGGCSLVLRGGGDLCYATSPEDVRCLPDPPPDPVYVRAAGSGPFLWMNHSGVLSFEVSNPALRAYQSTVSHCFPGQGMPRVVSVAPASSFVATTFFFGLVTGLLLSQLVRWIRRARIAHRGMVPLSQNPTENELGDRSL